MAFLTLQLSDRKNVQFIYFGGFLLSVLALCSALDTLVSNDTPGAEMNSLPKASPFR